MFCERPTCYKFFDCNFLQLVWFAAIAQTARKLVQYQVYSEYFGYSPNHSDFGWRENKNILTRDRIILLPINLWRCLVLLLASQVKYISGSVIAIVSTFNPCFISDRHAKKDSSNCCGSSSKILQIKSINLQFLWESKNLFQTMQVKFLYTLFPHGRPVPT